MENLCDTRFNLSKQFLYTHASLLVFLQGKMETIAVRGIRPYKAWGIKNSWRSPSEDFVNKNYALAAERNCSVHTYAWRGGVTINQTSAFSLQCVAQSGERDSGDERRRSRTLMAAAPEDNNARARAQITTPRTDICQRRWLLRSLFKNQLPLCAMTRIVYVQHTHKQAREGELCIATPNLHVKAFLRPVCLSHNRRRARGTQLLH